MVVNELKLTLTNKKSSLLRLIGRVSRLIIFKEDLPQSNNIKVSNRPVALEPRDIFLSPQSYSRNLNWRRIVEVLNSTQLLKTTLVIKQYRIGRQSG